MDDSQFDAPTMMIQLTLDEMDAYPRHMNRRGQRRGDPGARFPQAPDIVELTYEQIGVINAIIQKLRHLPAENPDTYLRAWSDIHHLSKVSAWCYYIRHEMNAYKIFTNMRYTNTEHTGMVRLRGELAISLSYIGLYHRLNDRPERPIQESFRYFSLWLGLATRLHSAINVSVTIKPVMYNTMHQPN